jgi:hypothetical protein
MVVRQNDEWGFRRDEWPKAGKEGRKFVIEAGLFLDGNNEVLSCKRNNYVDECCRCIVKSV